MRIAFPYPVALLVVLGAAALFGGGCSDDIHNITLSSDEISATVTTQVLNWPDGDPVAGASWEIVQTGIAGTTGPDGTFVATGLGRGTYLVRVGAAGHHATLMTLAILPPAKSTPWHQTETVYLMQPRGAVTVNLVAAGSGDPVSGARVRLAGCRFPPGVSNQQLAAADIVAVSDANGAAALAGLPVGTLDLVVEGTDTDGDDVIDFAGQGIEIAIAEGQVGHVTLALSPPGSVGTLNVIDTNLPSYGNALFENELYFIFSDSMDTAATTWSLTYDAYPYDPVELSGTWTSPFRIALAPGGAFPAEATRFDFVLDGVAVTGDSFRSSMTFVWQRPGGGGGGGGECTEIVADLGLTAGVAPDFDTRNFTLEWSIVPCAGGYDIYGRDDRNVPSWVHLAHNPIDFETGTIQQLVQLPPQFDRYAADDVQTPLAGTAVSLCVVPANAAIPTPGEDHAIVVVGDVTPPSLIAVGSAGVFANPSAATVKGDLVVSFSEYLGPGTPDPVLEIREAGGDPAYVLNPATAQWSWDPGMASGRFRFPVPAGVDGTGDEFRITLSGAVDLSGNTAAADLVSEWALILPIPPVWDFESGPQDWFCADVGRWEWGAPTDGPGSGYQSQSCWGTDLDAYFGFNWDTRLESPPFIVPMANPRVRFVHYADLAYGDYFELIIATEAGEVVLLQYSTDYSVWQQAEISLAPYAGQLCRLVFRFVSNATSNDSGVFVDDVSVTGD